MSPSAPARRRFLAAVSGAALLGGLLPAAAGPALAAPSELFVSEYIEGTSNNKALEVFNGTGGAVNLATGAYNVQMFFNGSATAGLTINLTGTVAHGDVFVLAHSSASAAILAQADQTNGAGWFNGDDAVVLRKGTTIVDVVGQIGFDPGTEWGSGVTSTADNTLRRKTSIEAGDANGSDAFDPAVQWDGFATDTFAGLGAHTLTTGGDTAPSVVSSTPAPGALDVAVDADVVVEFSEDVATSGAWFAIACQTSGPHSAAVTGGPRTFTFDPDDDFALGETCTVTIEADLVSDADVDDPPDHPAADHVFSFTTDPLPASIPEIQGSGAESPLAGRRVATSGIVTVVLGAGIFVQDIGGDGDEATSDGIFVFLGNAGARARTPGETVDLVGTVVEFRTSSRPRDLPLTELSSATVTAIGTAALPTPVVIDDRPDEIISPDGIDAFERLEGMLVSIDDPRVTGPTNDFGEIIVVASGDGPSVEPDGSIVVRDLADDAVDYNPERIMVDDEARLSGGTGSGTRINNPMVRVAIGAQASGDIVGALDYQFSNYRVQANHAVSGVLAAATAPASIGAVAPAEPWEGRISSFNVENLFDCVDAPGKEDDHPTCSAATVTALDRQLTKLAAAFEDELGSPQLVVIEETENAEVLTGDAAGFVPGTSILALLPRLSSDYDAVSFDASDGRGIEVAFVWDTARVVLHEAYQATDRLPDSGGIFDGTTFGAGREPIVGSFTVDDVAVTVVGNHFKSKGGPQFGVDPTEQPAGDDPLYGSFQPPTRFTEELRHLQADYVRALVDDILADDPAANLIVAGDLNDFAFGEPGEGQDTVARIADSTDHPLTNVIDLVAGAYTFVFEGNAQVLDHMLLTGGMAALLEDQAIAHFNAGQPSAFGANAATTLRSSDHDPLIADFCTDATPPTLAASAAPSELFPPNHKYVTVEVTTTASDDRDPDPALEFVSVVSSQADSGLDPKDRPNDIVIVDDDTFNLRAERFLGEARTYTITYRLTDACGNASTAAAVVTVPIADVP